MQVLLVTTVLSAVIAVSVDCIVKDLKDVGCALATVGEVIRCYHPNGFIQDTKVLTHLQLDFVDVENAMETAIDDMRDTCPFSEEEVTTVAVQLLALEQPIKDGIKLIESKRCDFDRAFAGQFSVSPLIKANLKNLKLLFDELVAVFKCKSPKSWASTIDGASAGVEAQFQHAICITYKDVHLRGRHDKYKHRKCN